MDACTSPNLASHKAFFDKQESHVSTPDFYARREVHELLKFLKDGTSPAVKGCSAVELLLREDPAISSGVRVQAWREVGTSYAIFGKWKEATSAYQSALTYAQEIGSDGDVLREIRHQIARCKVSTNELGEAKQILHQVRVDGGVNRSPTERANDLFVRFHIGRATGDMESATRVLERYAVSLDRRPIHESTAFAETLARETVIAFKSNDLSLATSLFELGKQRVLGVEGISYDTKMRLLYAASLPYLTAGRLTEAKFVANKLIEVAESGPIEENAARRGAYAARMAVLVSETAKALKGNDLETATIRSLQAVDDGRRAGAPMLYEALRLRERVQRQLKDYAGEIESVSERIRAYDAFGYRRDTGELSTYTKQEIIEARISRVTVRWAANPDNLKGIVEACEMDLQVAEEMLNTCPEGGAPDVDAKLYAAWYNLECIRGEDAEIDEYMERIKLDEDLDDAFRAGRPELPMAELARLAYRVHRAVDDDIKAVDSPVFKVVKSKIFNGANYSKVLETLDSFVGIEIGDDDERSLG